MSPPVAPRVRVALAPTPHTYVRYSVVDVAASRPSSGASGLGTQTEVRYSDEGDAEGGGAEDVVDDEGHPGTDAESPASAGARQE